MLSVAVVPVGLTQFSHLYTGKPNGPRERGARSSTQVERWGAARAAPSAARPGCSAPTSSTCSPARAARAPSTTATSPRSRTASARSPRSACACATGSTDLPRSTASASASSPGLSMAPLMPALLERLAEATGATFELIVAENSLFGPTMTTAGLLVGADIRRALADRHDLDLALIPAETINDDGVFLDDVPLRRPCARRCRCRCSRPTISSTSWRVGEAERR